MALGVDRDLHIVAHGGGAFAVVAIERASGSLSKTCWSGAP
jgi:hypothetical protein